jgi:O-antigen/teichoic acid export membrane protein
VVVLYIDKVMIGTFYSPEHVGQYHGAARLNRILLFFSGAAMTLLMPSFFQLVEARDMAGVRKLLQKAERYLSMIVMLFVAVLVSCADGVVYLTLGGEFHDAASYLEILTLVAWLSTLGRPLAMLIIALNYTGLYAAQCAMAWFLAIVLNLIFVPKSLWGMPMLGWGPYGAAVVTVTVGIIGLSVARVVVWKLARIAPYWGVLKHLLAGLIMVCLCWELQKRWGYSRWVALGLHSTLSATGYVVLLVLFKELNWQDARYIFQNVRFGAMKQYGLSELNNSTTSQRHQ